MKILDRYIAKNFLFGYFIALFVMIGMFLTVDLFIHLDEFAENSDLGFRVVLSNIFHYYGIHTTLWFRDLAGMIIVIAAVFSLARMTRNNELIAIMASGVSLKRILAPILVLSLLLTTLMVLDQEVLIPGLSRELTRKQDEMSNSSRIRDLWFIGDDRASLICSERFDEAAQTLFEPTIILREPVDAQARIYRVTARIQASEAIYDANRGGWKLVDGRILYAMGPDNQAPMTGLDQNEQVDFYQTKLTAADIPIRQREEFKNLLSLRQLTELENNRGTRRMDVAELAMQKHSRVTAPIVNMVMLMIALPVLVCRDPKAMKTAILVSFLTTGSCFLVVFLCRLFATEDIFGRIQPAFWTWAPIFIFFPIAIVQIDSMRT